jgi:outer membrane protein
MAARDAYDAARETVAAARQQMVILEKSLALGISSEVQYDEVRGKRGQAEADQFQAESEMRLRIAKLEQLTGPLKDFTPPSAMSEEDAQAVAKLGKSLEEWLASAHEKAPSILAARAGLDNAKEEVTKQQAQHMPTLDLVGSVNYNAQAATGNFPGQSGYRSKQQAVGLQLNIPLYAGGSQNAKVREAVALQSKAEADLEAALRTVEVNVKQAWAGLQAASGRHPALGMTVKAARSAIRAAVEGQTRGLKTPADELQARQLFQVSERDRRRALYDVYVHTARLLAATGELNVNRQRVVPWPSVVAKGRRTGSAWKRVNRLCVSPSKRFSVLVPGILSRSTRLAQPTSSQTCVPFAGLSSVENRATSISPCRSSGSKRGLGPPRR